MESLPEKIIKSPYIIDKVIRTGQISPAHMKINITNRCNQNCSYCCRNNVDRDLEMPFDDILETISTYRNLGCKAVTISGGGEPLMHPQIDKIIDAATSIGGKAGLITNGRLLDRLTAATLKKLTWIRVSIPEETDLDYWYSLEGAARVSPNVDWGASHVITNKFNIEHIKEIIEFVNVNNFTHLRLVNDISSAVNRLKMVWAWIEETGINDRRVIYQDRKDHRPGVDSCPLGLLRPIVDTDGHIYACCATGEPERDYQHHMSLGTIQEIEKIMSEQRTVDGSQCRKCYWYRYNQLIGILLSETEHIEFI